MPVPEPTSEGGNVSSVRLKASVAELKAALEKLPADRQGQFRQQLEHPPRAAGKRR